MAIPQLEVGTSVLSQLESAHMATYLPLYILIGHVLLAVCGSLILGLLLKCQKVAVSKRRLLAYAMRIHQEMSSTTLITAAVLTVVILAHPAPISLRVGLIFLACAFGFTCVCVHIVAILRFHVKWWASSAFLTDKLKSEHDRLIDSDSSIETEDTALCFFLHGFFGSCAISVLRKILLFAMLSTMVLAIGCSTQKWHALVVSTSLLLLLVLSSASHLMKPALHRPTWTYEQYQRAVRRGRENANDGPLDGGEKSGGKCEALKGLVSLLAPLPSREVVLQESTKLACNEFEQHVEDAATAAPSASLRGMAAANEV